MPRLTITLTPERHRALKETAARTNRSIRSLVEESLDAYGIRTLSRAASLVRSAREQSRLTEAEALRLARAETRAQRRR
ncbi:MAG: CopG family transcriptional regulator [Acidobacteriota bacterium]